MFFINYITKRKLSSKQKLNPSTLKNFQSKLILELIKAKLYLGLSLSSWNSKVKYGLEGIRNDFCVIDMRKTAEDLTLALGVVSKISRRKKVIVRKRRKKKLLSLKKSEILFVGFPETEQKNLKLLYKAKKHHYVNEEFWINGLLTNGSSFVTYRNNFLKNYSEQSEADKEIFFHHFEGILNLNRKPDLVFIYNHSKGIEIFKEANSLRIPVISFLNTSDDPTLVDYPVLGNFNYKDAGSLYYKLIKRFLK